MESFFDKMCTFPMPKYITKHITWNVAILIHILGGHCLWLPYTLSCTYLSPMIADIQNQTQNVSHPNCCEDYNIYIYIHIFQTVFFFRCILESDGKVAKSWLFFFIHHFDKKSLHFLPSPQNARFQRLHFRLRTHFEEMADQPQWISLAKTSGAGWEGDLFTTRRLPRFFFIFLFHSFLSKTWRSFLVNNEFIAIVFVKKNLIKIQSPVTIF